MCGCDDPLSVSPRLGHQGTCERITTPSPSQELTVWTKKRLGQEEESGVPLGQTSACRHCPPCTQHHTQPPPPPEAHCPALVQAACPWPQGCSGHQRGPLPGLSFEDEKTGLGQTQGPVSLSYKGKDGKEAWKTAAPGPFPHSGAVHTFPTQPHRGASVHQQSGQAPTLHSYLTPIRGTAACSCYHISERGRTPRFHGPSKKRSHMPA